MWAKKFLMKLYEIYFFLEFCFFLNIQIYKNTEIDSRIFPSF